MRERSEGFIERRIITGLIVSKEYLDRVQSFWNPSFLESTEFRIVAGWCIEYYKQYKKAPDMDIQSIYMEKLKAGNFSKAQAEYIEEVLDDLSSEFGRDTQFNASYLYDQTINYFKSQELAQHNERLEDLIAAGKVEEAELLANSYKTSVLNTLSVGIDLSSKEAMDRMEAAFTEDTQRVLSYPGALGYMWNEHMVRGGFVAFLAPEKRGKTFLLMEIALRGISQRANVAFFQAGDMTEASQLKRIGVYLARTSDRERYCVSHYQPVGDCVFNQLDTCTRKDRNCDHGIFNDTLENFQKNKKNIITLDNLKKKAEEFPDYEPCDSMSCPHRKGSVWIKQIKAKEPLTARKAVIATKKFFRKYKRNFKLVTYPAGTLSPNEMERCLQVWEKEEGFVPDIILVDYADIMAADSDGGVSEFRHKTNSIWQGLRGLSQKQYALLVTATQADADSYKQGKLGLGNFSEDKRKYAHVTAMYGLNQDPDGREKKLGILRVNELVVREGEYNNNNEVHVLQDLYAGRPYIESFS